MLVRDYDSNLSAAVGIAIGLSLSMLGWIVLFGLSRLVTAAVVG